MLLARVFLPFAQGFFLSYVYRSVHGVLFGVVGAELAIDAAAFATIAAAYPLTFALVQPVLGLALDRYGPRAVNAGLLVVAAVGAWWFAHGRDALELALAFGMVGLGVSACLMASMKAFAVWFPLERLALLNGLFMAIGGLGAMAATAPVEALLAITDWRGVFRGLAIATLAAAIVIWIAVPREPRRVAALTWADSVRGAAAVFADRRFWRPACVAMTALAGMFALTGLWIGAWLRDVAGYDRPAVAATLFATMASLTAGYIAFGALAAPLERRGIAAVRLFATGVAVATAMLALAALLPVAVLRPIAPLLWCAYSFTIGAGTLGFSILVRAFPQEIAGSVNTSLNVAIFGGGFLVQAGIGVIVAQWPQLDGGFPPAAYAVALGLLALVQAAAIAYLWATRARV